MQVDGLELAMTVFKRKCYEKLLLQTSDLNLQDLMAAIGLSNSNLRSVAWPTLT